MKRQINNIEIDVGKLKTLAPKETPSYFYAYFQLQVGHG